MPVFQWRHTEIMDVAILHFMGLTPALRTFSISDPWALKAVALLQFCDIENFSLPAPSPPLPSFQEVWVEARGKTMYLYRLRSPEVIKKQL